MIICYIFSSVPDRLHVCCYFSPVAFSFNTLGGRITDGLDQRLVNVYMTQLFCEETLDPQMSFNLAAQLGYESPYRIPPDADLECAKNAIRSFPHADPAAAFGQHINAEISSQIADSNRLLLAIASLQPKTVVEDVEASEAKVLQVCRQMLTQVPELFDVVAIRIDFDNRSDPDPLKTVLYQELDRYNKLLAVVHKTLAQIELSVQGLIVVTPELEDIITAVLDFKVPKPWSRCYPSLKTLSSWMRDLVCRVSSFHGWIDVGLPRCFWLPGFTYPTGFLTALLQTVARQNCIPIDTLSWEFPIVNTAADAITQHAKEGAYCHGMFLEGARWDCLNDCLAEPKPMELVCSMPVIHMRPTEGSKSKSQRGFYACPLYMYPVRTGSRERPSFVVSCDISSGYRDADYWTCRGTAMTLATMS